MYYNILLRHFKIKNVRQLNKNNKKCNKIIISHMMCIKNKIYIIIYNRIIIIIIIITVNRIKNTNIIL